MRGEYAGDGALGFRFILSQMVSQKRPMLAIGRYCQHCRNIVDILEAVD